MAENVFVILREVGEFSNHDVAAIRYVLTEEDAMAAVALADLEKQTKAHLKPPYPPHKSSYAFLMPDGSWVESGANGFLAVAKYTRKPDADQIEAEAEAALAEYNRLCLEMGCVDPGGPEPDARYYYEEVPLYALTNREQLIG